MFFAETMLFHAVPFCRAVDRSASGQAISDGPRNQGGDVALFAFPVQRPGPGVPCRQGAAQWGLRAAVGENIDSEYTGRKASGKVGEAEGSIILQVYSAQSGYRFLRPLRHSVGVFQQNGTAGRSPECLPGAEQPHDPLSGTRRHRLLALLLGALLCLTVGPSLAYAEKRPKNLAGGEIGYILRPFGTYDPYSWALGGSVFYERHELFRELPLFIGGEISVHGFTPLAEVVRHSIMLRGSIYGGYAFAFPFHGDFTMSLAPYLGYSHYWRKIWYETSTDVAYRPILQIGLIVDAIVEKHLVTGQNAEGLVIFDNRILFALAQNQRFGWRF